MKFPLVAAPVVLQGGRALVRLAAGERVIEAPARLLAELFARCDGCTPMKDVVRALGAHWHARETRRLLAALEKDGIVRDASTAALSAWEHVRNPNLLASKPDRKAIAVLVGEADAEGKRKTALRYRRVTRSRLLRLMERRRSDRSFSGAPVAAAAIRQLLWAAYGVQKARSASARTVHRVVPSAGKLFPLRVHLINLHTSGSLRPGIYRVHFASDGAVALKRVGRVRAELYRAFVDPQPLRRAQGIFLLSGNLGRNAQKYGNRALLYTALEAGHAAQNVLLAAAELGVGAVEIGGFLEDRMETLLAMGPDELLLTSIVFGVPEAARRERDRSGVEFSWVDFAPGQPEPSFFLGRATSDDDGPACWGGDRDPLLARDKAVAETYDRLGFRTPRNLREARWTELEHALDPRTLVAYDARQYRRASFPFRPFDTARRYAWTEGQDYLGGRGVAVLADCVHMRNALPSKFSRRPYSGASTSGVAAYPTRDGALERAVLELIERDAFMRTWLAGAIVPEIAWRSLPGEARQGIRALRGLGLRIAVKSLTRDTVPVMMLFAQHAGKKFTAITAAAAYAPEQALEHALMELESSVLVRLNALDPPSIVPRAVRTPQDHAALYAQASHFRRADRLGKSGSPQRFAAVAKQCARDWSGLVGRLHRNYGRLVSIDITPPGAAVDEGRRKLHVLRAFVPGLVPVSFGFDAEPLGLPAVRALVPAAARARPLFPHPFS